MRKLIQLTSVVAILACAAPAFAGDGGFTLGLRTGYGMPLGTAGDGVKLGRLTWGAVPVQLDVGYRLLDNLEIGGYFSYGFAGLSSDARSALEASGATKISGHVVQRVGLQATYRLMPGNVIVPWATVGFGYEWLRYASADVSTPNGTDELEVGFGGLEASLTLGAEYEIAPSFAVGPYLGLSAGRYDRHLATVDAAGASDGSVGSKALHEWLSVGVKATYRL